MKKAVGDSAPVWGWVLRAGCAVSPEHRPNLEGFVIAKFLLQITLLQFPDETSLDSQTYSFSQISAAFANADLGSTSSVWIL